jgi:hypothetical protein
MQANSQARVRIAIICMCMCMWGEDSCMLECTIPREERLHVA